MKKNDNFTCKIFFPNELIHDKEITGHVIAVYSVLQMTHTLLNEDKICVTHYMISYYLTGQMDLNQKTYEAFTRSFKLLEEKGYIRIIKNESRNYVIDCSKLHIDTKNTYFTMVTFDEIKKIMSVQGYVVYNLLKYFSVLISSINNNVYIGDCPYDRKTRVVGTMTIQWLSDKSGFSYKSLIDYNKILEKNGLIYIYRSNDFYLNKDNRITKLANIYGRLENKELIDKFAISQKKYNNTYKFSKEANSNRRCAQIYHQIVKGNANLYSLQEIKNSYDYIWAKNDYYEELYKNTRKEEYKEKIRDMSIYDPFDFSEVL